MKLYLILHRFFIRFLVVFMLICQCNMVGFAQYNLNLDFELTYNDATSPRNWDRKGSAISLDSLEKHHGKYSLRTEMSGMPNRNNRGEFQGILPVEYFAGKQVEYKGWIKTKDIKNGYAGLWIKVLGGNFDTLGFDNMNDRGLTGENDWTQVSITTDISKDAVQIEYGGFNNGSGVAWFDNFELFVNGEKLIEPEHKTSLSQNELVTLKKYVYPLRTFEPDGGDTKDLQALDRLIGSGKVIALGEVTHGSNEIFKMKNRIVQYLAANQEFDIFSFEWYMPESYKLNDYTVRGEGDPKKLITGMFWRTEELLNLIEWMRSFNRLKQRITYTGFDTGDHNGPIIELLAAFKENEAEQLRITELKKKLDQIRTRSVMNNWITISANENEVKDIDSILSLVQNSIEVAPIEISKKYWLQQNIVIIKQCIRGLSINLWRDKCMADNFLWIKEQNPNSKFIISAHNTHIKKTSQMMGYHLAQNLDDDYVTIGCTFYEGNFTGGGRNGLTSYEAIQAYPGTLEFLLEQLNEPIFILDLKKIKSDNNNDVTWLKERLPYRRTGNAGGNPFEFEESKITDDFDYLIFIRTSSPTTLLPNPN